MEKATNNNCFVCNKEIIIAPVSMNTLVGMAVCNDCQGTQKEKEKENELLDSLADGLVCGCI